MLLIVKCPYCAAETKIPEKAARATCPKCERSFAAMEAEEAPSSGISSRRPEMHAPSSPTHAEGVMPASTSPSTGKYAKAPASAKYEKAPSTGKYEKSSPSGKHVPVSIRDDDEEESALPAWISGWGAVAFVLGTLALLLASPYLVGVRLVTLLLSALGMMVVFLGVAATRGQRTKKDRIWFAVGGLLNGLILLLALFLPGVLNTWWELERAVRPPNPDKQVVVPRFEPKAEGRSASTEEWVDAVDEAIRQDDVFLSVQSVKAGPLPGKGTKSGLLIHVRLGNSGHVGSFTFEGFARDKHTPVLSSDGGRDYPFQEQQMRYDTAGGPIDFKSQPVEVTRVLPARYIDVRLVFQSPSSQFDPVKLELPASAWGRQGMCRFHIPRLFVAGLPDLKKQ
jgi:hypothetical protein